MRLAAAWLALAVTGAVATPASAADAPPVDQKPEARERLEAGLRLYNVQRYSEAAEAFRAAYLIDARPELLYSIGQSERMAGHCARAGEAYRAYLRTDPPRAKADFVRQQIDRCTDVAAPSPTASTPRDTAEPPQVAPAAALVASAPAAAAPARSRRGVWAAVITGAVVLVGAAAATALALTLPAAPPHTDLGNYRPLP